MNKLSIEAGLRYENSKSTIDASGSKHNFSTSEFFPSLNINYEFSNKFGLSLDYSGSISRQQFSDINPNRIYLDSLAYIIGNPLLKPSFSNYYEISFLFWKDLNLSFSYEKITNPTIFAGMNDERNQDITKFSYINLDKGKYYNINLSYSLSKGNYSGAASFNLSCPDFKIPYLDSIHKIRKVMSVFSITNSYSINKNLSLFCDFRYRGPREYGIAYWKEQYNLSAGIRYSLLKNSINISLLFNDILQKNSSGNYDEKYNNISNGMRINQDTRLARFAIRYNFNNIKSKVKRNISNQKELNRL
jgi:outer membrane receptor for ferrienterochelin and colicin